MAKKQQPYHIEVYEHADGQWGYRFRRKGRIIFSTEGYTIQRSARRALNAHIKAFQELAKWETSIEVSVIPYQERNRWKRSPNRFKGVPLPIR